MDYDLVHLTSFSVLMARVLHLSYIAMATVIVLMVMMNIRVREVSAAFFNFYVLFIDRTKIR